MTVFSFRRVSLVLTTRFPLSIHCYCFPPPPPRKGAFPTPLLALSVSLSCHRTETRDLGSLKKLSSLTFDARCFDSTILKVPIAERCHNFQCALYLPKRQQQIASKLSLQRNATSPGALYTEEYFGFNPPYPDALRRNRSLLTMYISVVLSLLIFFPSMVLQCCAITNTDVTFRSFLNLASISDRCSTNVYIGKVGYLLLL